MTGVRREQSEERALGESVSWDERYGLWKVSPLLDWTEQDVWAYIKARNDARRLRGVGSSDPA